MLRQFYSKCSTNNDIIEADFFFFFGGGAEENMVLYPIKRIPE